MTSRTLDSKGRVSLGSQFAGQMVIVDDSDPACITIRPAVAIPANEAWLYKNEKALTLVRKGLEQARQGEFADAGPDLDADEAWAAEIED